MPRPPLVPPTGARLDADTAPRGYRVRLEVDPAQASFRGQVTVELDLAAARDHLWLNARGLTVEQATLEVAGATTAVAVTEVAERELIGFDLMGPVRGAARLTVAYRGSVTDDVLGLFRQRVGDHWYLYSQFEAMHARGAVPCFDEPSVKVPWQVTLVVPPGQVAVANTPEVARAVAGDGRLVIDFAPTPPMASYLLAIAVGPFDVVEVGPVGRAAVPARILVPAGRAADAAAMASQTPRVVAALERYFDRALPLAKLDQVVVPTFPGAMENLGLVTYGEEWVLASPVLSMAEARRGYLSIAGHELAHQWIGNLVTMAWWDDLWLKEALAAWLATKVVSELDPRRDLITLQRRAWLAAMERDRSPRAAAIRRSIATSDEADLAFDALTYDKGAALLAMFERAAGADRFRAAVRGFIADHADRTVTAADFARALATAEPAIAQALGDFIDQPGLPQVELALACDGAPAAVATVTRARTGDLAAAPATWRFPVCVRFPDSERGGAVGERCGWVAGAGGRVELGVAGCPAWLVGGAGGIGYYRLGYDRALAAALGEHLLEVPVIDRSALAASVIGGLATGQVEVGAALTWVERLLAGPDRRDTLAAVELVVAIDALVGPAQRPRWQAWLRTRLAARARAAGLRARIGETEVAASARRGLVGVAGLIAAEPAVIARGEAAVREWLDGGTALAGPELGLALQLAAAGRDQSLFARMVARMLTADRATRRLLVTALAAASEPATIERALGLAVSDRLAAAEAVELLGGLLARPAAHDLTWAALAAPASSLTGRLPPDAWPALAYRTAALCTAAQRDALAPAFADRGVEPVLAHAAEQIDRCIADRARHAAALAAVLGGP